MGEVNKEDLRRLCSGIEICGGITCLMKEDIFSIWTRLVTPSAILSLLDENAGLLAQNGRDSQELRSLCQARDDARKERDQLRAELKSQSKDAERYRWLRERVGVDFIFGDYSPWIPSEGVGMEQSDRETTDAAIDQAIDKDDSSSSQNTGHGHVFPRPDGVRMRCGGPGICEVCSRDLSGKEG